MKIKLTKKQRFFISLIILIILLYCTRTKQTDAEKTSPSSSPETETIVETDI